jgi:uncharacterized ferritin-like protein (DUF455 family)
MTGSLADAAVQVLTTADADRKAADSRCQAAAWFAGDLTTDGSIPPPDRPTRPARPELRLPRDMPKRRKAGSISGRIALLHALAHIELNAIDLAWDIVARFHTLPDGSPLPRTFIDDWVRVADDEARHFQLLSARLHSLGAGYGDLPAHDGLWQASEATADDLAARLAIVPMVLEARGLDVTPMMINSLLKAGDSESAAVLQTIHDDEISHVAAGRRWFDACARSANRDPADWWQELVRTRFRGDLKRPFNHASRGRADFPADWYEPLGVG